MRQSEGLTEWGETNEVERTRECVVAGTGVLVGSPRNFVSVWAKSLRMNRSNVVC
jgi:hypothetical protein